MSYEMNPEVTDAVIKAYQEAQPLAARKSEIARKLETAWYKIDGRSDSYFDDNDLLLDELTSTERDSFQMREELDSIAQCVNRAADGYMIEIRPRIDRQLPTSPSSMLTTPFPYCHGQLQTININDLITKRLTVIRGNVLSRPSHRLLSMLVIDNEGKPFIDIATKKPHIGAF